MSEAELHVIKARLQGGILNKARRGELQSSLPVGFVYNPLGQPTLDPDKQVRESLALLFVTFQRIGSATGTVKHFHKQNVLFPRRLKKGPHKGDLLWGELTHSRVLQVLHNPRYAGAFVYGRTRTRQTADGGAEFRKRPRDQWILLPGVHEGYISWEQYEANQRRLHENAQALGADRRRSPPREGPALLQGLVLCGVCGRRMTVRYHHYGTRRVPSYVCQKEGIENAKPACQSVHGEPIDKAIGELLVQTVTPMTLDVAMAVQQEIQTRIDEVDRLRRKQVERARYEADLAQRRYLHVDPANRLVADTLEAEWNNKLRALNAAQEEYERLRQSDRIVMDEKQRARVSALASDFPRLWRDPKTADQEKKRMIRLIVEDVTLLKGDHIDVHVRFRGGAITSLALPLPLSLGALRRTDDAVIHEIDRLLDEHTEQEIAGILNAQGMLSREGRPFHRKIVANLARGHHLKDRFTRLREAGMLTMEEVAARAGIVVASVKNWLGRGLLRAHRYNDKGECLFEPPPDDLPRKGAHKVAYLRQKEVSTKTPKGVQYEA